MKRGIRALAAVALLSATGAFAVAKGGTLYIKSKDTKILKEPKAGAAAVSTVQPGTEVVWNGPSEKDKQFHAITVGGKQGFVLMANLSPNKPAGEIDKATGKSMDTKAFASSGAATKGLTEASLKYSKEKDLNKSTIEVIYAEEHSKNKGTPEAIASKSKELGGAK